MQSLQTISFMAAVVWLMRETIFALARMYNQYFVSGERGPE